MKRVVAVLVGIGVLGALALGARWIWPRSVGLVVSRVFSNSERHTIASRLGELGAPARSRLAPLFARAGVVYPPGAVTLVVLKDERRLELYAGATTSSLRFVQYYPILAASGGPGPKLREGDRQVPEGLYGIESLNPNSRYRVSLRVNYPNAFDRRQATIDGRTNLGGDIMIHGGAASIGCVAIGDPGAEEMFVLAADVGTRTFRVISAPVDFRVRERSLESQAAPLRWLPALYAEIRAALAQLPPVS